MSWIELKPQPHQYNLFLDDIRMPYEPASYCHSSEVIHYRQKSWDIVRTSEDFKKKIEEKGIPNIISFDFFLNDWDEDGLFCAEWLLKKIKKEKLVLPNTILCHSMSMEGRKKILELFKTYIINFKINK